MPHRCAIYTRQSRNSRGDFSSCEAQFKLCFVFINSMQAQEWSLVDNRYDDLGQSSETLHRPAMERLISDIEDGLIDRVIVTRLDRISRRLQHTCNFFQILGEMGTAITIASQPEIGGDAQGRLLINLMAAFAEFEQDMTCSRMEEARIALKSHGRRIAGRVPYGYCADPITKQLLIAEPEGERVRTIFQQAANGMKPSQIAASANQQQWSSNHGSNEPKFGWTPRRILAILSNRQYIGDIPYDNEWIPGQHEPIVTLDLFSAAQIQIETRRIPMRRVSIPSQKHEHFLKGLVQCPSCGRNMSVSTKINRRKGKVTLVRADYCCRSTAGGQPPCPGMRIDSWALEKGVMEALDGIGKSKKANNTHHEDYFDLRVFANEWAILDAAQKKKVIPLIVKIVTLNKTFDKIKVQLKSDALDYFE